MREETESKSKRVNKLNIVTLPFVEKNCFVVVLCFLTSICDAESQFNDGKNEMYHLPIHYKELEQLRKT